MRRARPSRARLYAQSRLPPPASLSRAAPPPFGVPARRRRAASAPIAHAVFGEIGVVSVARAEFVFDVAIVLGARVPVGDLERDWCTGGQLRSRLLVGKHAGQDGDLVRLPALGGVTRL